MTARHELLEIREMHEGENRSVQSLLAAIAAGIGASLCCTAPLVLVSLGVGGAWVASLTKLEPYRPIFIGLTLFFLFLAYRRLYRVPATCAPGDACAVPATRRNQRIIFWIVSVLLLGLLAFPYYALLFY